MMEDASLDAKACRLRADRVKLGKKAAPTKKLSNPSTGLSATLSQRDTSLFAKTA
jgi:hypothetical protein